MNKSIVMAFDKNEPITYGVPLHEVEGESYFDGINDFLYPSASASYPIAPEDSVSLIDQDFCDIIDALSEFDGTTLAWGHSPVAMPVVATSADDSNISQLCTHIPVQYAVPEICVESSEVKVVPANAVRPIDVDEGQVVATAEYCGLDDFLSAGKAHQPDLYLEPLSDEEKKNRRMQAIQRWRKKKSARQSRQQQKKKMQKKLQKPQLVTQAFAELPRQNLSHPNFDSLKSAEIVLGEQQMVPIPAGVPWECTGPLRQFASAFNPDVEKQGRTGGGSSRNNFSLNTILPKQCRYDALETSAFAKQECDYMGAEVGTTAAAVKREASAARQRAAASRVREKGKFKRSKTTWIPITDFYCES